MEKKEQLNNEMVAIEVNNHGAELCSIKAQGKEYLWQASPAFWKRHSPVLFPIVGRVWEDTYRYNGCVYNLSQHGFARDMDFELIEKKDNLLLYRLTSNEESRKRYPFDFDLEIGYRLHNTTIDVIWRVKNTTPQKEMFFQIGAHPAFYFPNFDATATERGYFGFDKDKDLRYILISEKGCADTTKEYPLQLERGLLPINTHTFDHDALILQDSQVHRITLIDKEHKPYITLSFDTPVVGLWSPPAKNAPFVCIEPWYGRCDKAHFDGTYDQKDYIQHLSAGEVFEGGYRIKIELEA